jgi:hypothetical protein
VTEKTTINSAGTISAHKLGDKFEEPGPEEKSWLAKVRSFATGALHWISQAYADLKSEVSPQVARVEPGELCSQKCLGTILDGALASMGIPPRMPNFDQLVKQGMDCLAQQAAVQVGIPEAVTRAGGAKRSLIRQPDQDDP